MRYLPPHVLMAYPLEQGLKLDEGDSLTTDVGGLNGLSTRTRIETSLIKPGCWSNKSVLMAYPLEQGLKRWCGFF